MSLRGEKMAFPESERPLGQAGRPLTEAWKGPNFHDLLTPTPMIVLILVCCALQRLL